jgi:hypothetical protein
MTCISKICSSTKPKINPQDQELVRTTPLTPELRERALKQKQAEIKIEKVVGGLREGHVFPKGES